MQPLRISFRVSPFPTTFPSFFTLLLRLSLVVVITRPRCGRTLKPFRSDIFIFFFSFFPSTFFLFGSPGGFHPASFFFLESGFFFFYQKSISPVVDRRWIFSFWEFFFVVCCLAFNWLGGFFFFGGVFCLFALRVSPSFQLRAAVRRGRLVTRSAAKRRRFMAFFIICSDSDSKKKEHKRESPRRLMKYHLSGSCYFAQRMRKKSSPETKKTDFFADGDSPPGLALRMRMRSATQCVASRNDQ